MPAYVADARFRMKAIFTDSDAWQGVVRIGATEATAYECPHRHRVKVTAQRCAERYIQRLMKEQP